MSAVATYPVGTIAKLLVLTERQVQSLVVQGVLPKAERGRYELVPVVQAYIKYLRERRIGSEAGAVEEIGPLRARVMKAKARVIEAEADLIDSTLLRRVDVQRAWLQILSVVRARVLAIPNNAARLAHAASSLAETSAVITDAVHEALEEISRTPVYVAADPNSITGPEPDGWVGAEDNGAPAEADGVSLGGRKPGS